MARSSLLPWGFSFYFLLFSVLILPIICQTPPGRSVITGPAIIRNGETVTITCSSTGGDPTPTVKWLRNDVVFDDTSASSGGVTRNSYTFTASTAEHLAVFECQTDNGVLQNPLTSTLFVIVNISPQTPTLTGTSNPAPNQQSTWTCTSTGGYPAPTMTMRIGNNQFSTSEFTTTSVAIDGAKSFTVTGTLNWSPTIGNNGQTLFCDVAHPTTLNTPQTVSLPLTVISPLAISATPTFYNPTIGNSVILNCVVTSGTATSITWLKDNSILNINGDARLTNGDVSTPSLSISNVQQSDSGSYVCRAADATGTVVNSNTITVTPQGLLSVDVSPNSANVVQGTNQHITCTVTGTPAATGITWTRLSNNQLTTLDIVNSNGKYTGGTTSNPHLTIINFQSSDAGTYVCRATNAAGSQNSDNSVLTYIPPLAISASPTFYNPTIGTTIPLNCVVTTGTATSIAWLKDNVILNINADSRLTNGDVSTPSLSISNIQQSDSGSYVCRAADATGTVVNSNTITVTHQAITESSSSDLYVGVIGGLVGFILMLMVTVGILLFKRKKGLPDGKQNTNITGTETTPSSANPITSEVYDYIREDTHDERNSDPGRRRVAHVTETTPSSTNPITSEVYDYTREDTHDERNEDPGTRRVEHVSSTIYQTLGMKDPPNTYSDLSSRQGLSDRRNYTTSNRSTKPYETLGNREESTHKYTDLANYQDPKEAEYIDTQM